MMSTIPEYFDRILDQMDISYIPTEFVIGWRLYLKSGKQEEMPHDMFETLVDMAEIQQQDVYDFLLADRIQPILDSDKIAETTIALRNQLLKRIPE